MLQQQHRVDRRSEACYNSIGVTEEGVAQEQLRVVDSGTEECFNLSIKVDKRRCGSTQARNRQKMHVAECFIYWTEENITKICFAQKPTVTWLCHYSTCMIHALLPLLGKRCSSAASAYRPFALLTQVRFPGTARDFSLSHRFFSRTYCAESLKVFVQPPWEIACTASICAHIKDTKRWQPYHCLDARNYSAHWLGDGMWLPKWQRGIENDHIQIDLWKTGVPPTKKF